MMLGQKLTYVVNFACSALFQRPDANMINSPSPKKKENYYLWKRKYDDQYDDNGVDVNALGDDDGYVEP
jgi:hypothetical protein